MAKITVIQITSPTCGVCKMIAPMVDKAISTFSPEDVEFRRVVATVDKEADDLVKELNVQSVPVFIFRFNNVEFDDDIVQGPMNFPQLKSKIENMLKSV